MQPTSIDALDTTWKRHFGPLLFCIHCLNAVWITRVFMINYEGISLSYLVDYSFCFSVFFIIILHIIRWCKILNIKIENNYNSIYTLKKDLRGCLNMIFDAVFYLIRPIPNDKLFLKIARNSLDNNLQNFKCKTNKDLFYEIIKNNKTVIAIHIFVFCLLSISVIWKLTPSILGGLLLSNWISYSVFHVLCLGLMIYSFIITIFYIFIRGN